MAYDNDKWSSFSAFIYVFIKGILITFILMGKNLFKKGIKIAKLQTEAQGMLEQPKAN